MVAYLTYRKGVGILRLSSGTEAVLGLRKLKIDALPTTAYLMLGSRCTNNCLFCSQSRSSKASHNYLSRVTWNSYKGNIWPLINMAFRDGRIFRACIQVVNNPGIFERLLDEVNNARDCSDIPICISGGVDSLEQVDILMSMGADRVSMAVDAVTPEIFGRIKGQDYCYRLELVKKCAQKYPGKVGTHLIAGLGETEEEMAKAIQLMYDMGVNVGLFAFTPVRGTNMEMHNQPSIESYRRIQIVHYNIRKGLCRVEDIGFEEGMISKLPFAPERIRELLADGSAFLTSGCPGCNRPYYNEKPGSIIYNYPRKMTAEEIEKAIEQAKLGC